MIYKHIEDNFLSKYISNGKDRILEYIKDRILFRDRIYRQYSVIMLQIKNISHGVL